MEESDPYGEEAEHLSLLMAVVPGANGGPINVLDEAGHGVVEYSVPFGDKCGCSSAFSPSISSYDYIVAAWGDGSFYTFNLAEKVGMTLGLTPRCVGNDQQRLVYDDLGLPEFGVAEGEVSSDYHWNLKRAVSWRMSNEYLRRYLWLRGARGVRAFYYSAQLADVREVRAIMEGKSHVVCKPAEGVAWYELDVREHKGGLLLQLWPSVEAVMPVLCPEQSADGILWPGDPQPMTHARANALLEHYPVYLNDRFLQKYEQSTFYDSTPVHVWGHWHCSPSYRGQWSFTECQRVGRNLIQPKARRRARTSSRGGVWRKPNPKARGDEQEPDARCGTSGMSRHVTAKSSIRGLGVLYKSGVYARNVLYLTLGDPPSAPGSREREKLAEQWGITVDRLAEVSRGQSRRRKRAGTGIRKPHLAEGPNGRKGEADARWATRCSKASRRESAKSRGASAGGPLAGSSRN